MANAILSARRKKNGYQLKFIQRRTLLAQADNPGGKIPRSALLKIELQRNRFIKFHGSAF